MSICRYFIRQKSLQHARSLQATFVRDRTQASALHEPVYFTFGVSGQLINLVAPASGGSHSPLLVLNRKYIQQIQAKHGIIRA